MDIKSAFSRVLAATTACAALCLASHAGAQCVGYTVAPGPGTFVAGTTDIGLYGDDLQLAVPLPFAFSFYGTTYNSVNVCTNGFLEFVTIVSPFTNGCLPAAGIAGPAIMPFWDDLWTAGPAAGQGIFTDLSGPAGSRVFVIEYRAVYFTNGVVPPVLDFEVKFYEGQNFFDVFYSTPMADRCSATIGCQAGGTAADSFTQYSCNTNGVPGCSGAPTSGLSLRFSCVGAGIAGACCNPAAGTCGVATAATCPGAGNFLGVGSSCPGTCAQPGACCNTTTGVCSQTGVTGCVSPSTFSGIGSLCTPNPCVGGCCNPTSGACTLTSASGCVSPNAFQSLGTVCLPNPCPQPPPPANDSCATVLASGPTVPAAGGTVSGSTQFATNDGDCTCDSNGVTPGKDIYWRFTPNATGAWQFSLCSGPQVIDTVISIHSGCPADTTNELVCDDDTCGALGGLSDATASLTAGTTYLIRVAMWAPGATGGAVTLVVGELISGACCDAGSGACTFVTPATCGANNFYLGNNQACPGATCPVVGTCCGGIGSCSARFGPTCRSGLTPNAATSCTPTLCPSLPHICENFDATAAGSLPNGWSSTSTGAGSPWTVVSDQSNSSPNSAFTNDLATVSSQFLVLPAVTAAGPLTLDLWARYGTEPTFDGWTVEVSTDAGATFTNIGDSAWTLNGYNTTISAAFMSPISGQRAFAGDNAATLTWTEHTATIPASAGSSVIIRINMSSDNSVAHTGVWIDDLCVGNISTGASGVCCRGATCSTTVTTSAACTGSLIGGQTAGASFPTGAACNSAGSTTTPCCYADYNKVGGITVQDIFDFLQDWFASSRYANTGGTGAPGPLAVQNIFDFLTAWFNGGC